MFILRTSRPRIGISALKHSIVICIISITVYAIISVNENQNCIVPIPKFIGTFLNNQIRSCSFCSDFTEIKSYDHITKTQFQELVRVNHPFVVKQGVSDWAAVDVFGFEYFKTIFANQSENSCQFFPYKTNFTSLKNFFTEMNDERALMMGGVEPWYVGWSNCDLQTAAQLRKQYHRPYFLPDDSATSRTDWIFIGVPEYGAHMHVDNVKYASWQAQVKGSKIWYTKPPPECLYQCGMTIAQVELMSGDIRIKVNLSPAPAFRLTGRVQFISKSCANSPNYAGTIIRDDNDGPQEMNVTATSLLNVSVTANEVAGFDEIYKNTLDIYQIGAYFIEL